MPRSDTANRYSVNFDSFYDPDFTAEISNKMRVPERIGAVEGEDVKLHDTDYSKAVGHNAMTMHVPDRILVAGGDQHIGGRDPLPEVKVESSMLGDMSTGIQLATPPQTLTVTDHEFPVIGDADQDKKVRTRTRTTLTKLQNGDTSCYKFPRSDGSGPSTPTGLSGTDDELTVLRRQFRILNRRVLAVEEENQQRQQREIIMYSVGVIYFLLKGIFWLHRHW